MIQRTTWRQFGRRLGTMILLLLGALVCSLAIGAWIMGIPAADLQEIAMLFGTLGGIAGLVALGVIQPMLLQRLGSLRTQIIVVVMLGGILVAALLQGAARAMFINTEHDLPLLLLVLIFLLILAIGFGIALAGMIVQRINAIRSGTERLATGELDIRVTLYGSDELTALAQDFNHMADALQQAALRQQELEQARRDLVAAVSHDLRTPLTAVRAMIEALVDDIVPDQATKTRYLQSAQGQLQNLSQLVNDLFEIAQLDAGVLQIELERASLHDLISDTLSNLQPHAEQQRIQLMGEVAPDVDLVLMDPQKMQRVLYNLISNALRHTPADGTILLKAQANGDVIEVEVIDEGEGIANEDLARIFERTYRGEKSRSRDYGGAGLGLTIAQGFIEAHGGTIWAENHPSGARFGFTLQRAH